MKYGENRKTVTQHKTLKGIELLVFNKPKGLRVLSGNPVVWTLTDRLLLR